MTDTVMKTLTAGGASIVLTAHVGAISVTNPLAENLAETNAGRSFVDRVGGSLKGAKSAIMDSTPVAIVKATAITIAAYTFVAIPEIANKGLNKTIKFLSSLVLPLYYSDKNDRVRVLSGETLDNSVQKGSAIKSAGNTANIVSDMVTGPAAKLAAKKLAANASAKAVAATFAKGTTIKATATMSAATIGLGMFVVLTPALLVLSSPETAIKLGNSIEGMNADKAKGHISDQWGDVGNRLKNTLNRMAETREGQDLAAKYEEITEFMKNGADRGREAHGVMIEEMAHKAPTTGRGR